MVRKMSNILAIDWWTKYVWIAYAIEDSKVVLPVWNLLNDGSIYFNIWDVIARYKIKRIIVGYPNHQEDIQKAIDDFINWLKFIIFEDIEIEKYEEDYTSVEAWAVTWNFKKNPTEDTIAAMKILERYLNIQ